MMMVILLMSILTTTIMIVLKCNACLSSYSHKQMKPSFRLPTDECLESRIGTARQAASRPTVCIQPARAARTVAWQRQAAIMRMQTPRSPPPRGSVGRALSLCALKGPTRLAGTGTPLPPARRKGRNFHAPPPYVSSPFPEALTVSPLISGSLASNSGVILYGNYNV